MISLGIYKEMKLISKFTSHLSKLNSLKFRKELGSYCSFSQSAVASIHYDIIGSSNKAILCIPGALGSGVSDFSYQINGLTKDFKVVTIDPRGYGESRHLHRDFMTNFFEQDAADAAHIMKTLGIQKYSVLGWSDGGTAAMILAAKEQESVEKLVIWGSSSYVTEEEKLVLERTEDIDDWSENMRKPLEEIYGVDGLRTLWTDCLNGFYNFLGHPDGICIDKLPHIKCPTLILHGMKDPLCTQAQAEYLRDNISDSKLLLWPNGKHNIHMKFHEEFNETVRTFINK